MDTEIIHNNTEDMVECHYPNNVTVLIPKDILDRALREYQNGLMYRKTVNYKEGGKIFGVTAKAFAKHAKKARAETLLGRKNMVCVKIMDEYFESIRGGRN